MTDFRSSSPSLPVGAGATLSDWTERPTNVDVFLIGTAYWTTHRIHYDREWARQEGYDDVVVPGVLMYGWVERGLVALADSLGSVRSLRFRHTGLVCVNETVRISLVVSRESDMGEYTAREVAITITKAVDGSPVLTGTASMVLPHRNGFT